MTQVDGVGRGLFRGGSSISTNMSQTVISKDGCDISHPTYFCRTLTPLSSRREACVPSLGRLLLPLL